MLHLQVTTENEIGLGRRKRTISFWEDLELKPKYVQTEILQAERYPFYSGELNRYLNASIGCLKTHRKAWEIFLESSHDLALISEDDAVPSTNLIREIEKLRTGLQQAAYFPIRTQSKESFTRPILVQLGWHTFPHLKLKQLIAALTHVIKFRGPIKQGYVRQFSFGMHLYLLNREMARILLDSISSEALPVDLQIVTLSNFYTGTEILFMRSLYNLAVQERLDSSIEFTLKNESKSLGIWAYLRMRIQTLADAKSMRYSL